MNGSTPPNTASPKPRPSTTYSVVGHKPEAVRDELCRIWSQNLTLAGAPGEKFRWLYVDAPDVPETVFLLHAHESGGEGRPVGTNALNIRRFKLGNERPDARVGVCSDLAVDRAHRSLLPALQLVKSVLGYAASTFVMTYGFPNQKARSVVVRAGFSVLGEMRRHVRVLRHASYAKRLKERANIPAPVAWAIDKSDGTIAIRAAGAAIDVAKLLSRPLEVVQAMRQYRLEWMKGYDERFDSLWSAASSEYDIVGERTSAFLKWRYPNAEIVGLLSRGGGGGSKELLAYCLLERDNENRYTILDIFGHQADLEGFVDRLMPALWRRGGVSVSVSYLGAPKLAEIFASRGFIDRGDARTIVVMAGKNEPASERERFGEANRWHLFPIDEDT